MTILSPEFRWGPSCQLLLSKCHKLLEFCLCASGVAASPFNWPEGFAVTFEKNNNLLDPCPVSNIIICQNHINLMYDKLVKWIHLGLQESSLINSDNYSYGFKATIPPPVKFGAGMSDFSDAC